jgi:hypothetical protein
MSALNISWIKQLSSINTTGYELTPDIALDSDSNIYLTYITDGTIPGGVSDGGYDVVVVKLDSSGTVIWKTQQPSFNTNAREYIFFNNIAFCKYKKQYYQ